MQTHDEADEAHVAPRRANQAKPEHTLDVARAVADPAGASPASLIELQRLAGNSTVSRMLSNANEEQAEQSPVLDVVGSGGGTPLEPGLRQEMEGRLGSDFSDVRVHTDSKASESARSVQASAYTVGSDVVFQSDQWSPASEEGRQTLAHELTHVVQQRAGPVAGTEVSGGIKLSSPGDEFERAADQTAQTALAAPAPVSGTSAAPTAQRQDEEEELEEPEELQGSFVQRQDEELEEPEELQGAFVQRQTEEEMLGEEEEAG